MEKRFVDPFFPNRPVDDPSRFSGRREQVDEVTDSLFQFANGNPKHTIITGDRGIGKSSLLLQAKLLAEGNNTLTHALDINMGVDEFNFIVAWHDADSGQTPQDISLGLLRELENRFRTLWSNLKVELDIAGYVKVYKKEEQQQSISKLVSEFCQRLTKVSQQASENGRHGVLLFVDELDRVKVDSGVASFFKLVTEKLNRDGVKNVGFFCAGITGAIQKLEDEHKSIARVFRDIPIPRLSEEETKQIIRSGFDKVEASYDESILQQVHHLAAGFPEPVHLLGSEMLSVSSTNHITQDDFEDAKLKIVRDVRRNRLSSLLEKAGSGKYQLILQAMADYDEGKSVPLSYISPKIGYKQNQYSTNMATLIDRGIITRESAGVYAFVDPLLREYVRTFGVLKEDTNVEE